MPQFEVSGQRPYVIEGIEAIHTPRLLIFLDRVKRNIGRMKDYLHEAAPGSGFRHLMPHVKTHKSSFIIKMMMEEGVTSFKTSMNEAELAAQCGAEEVFVAYPLLYHDACRIADLMSRYPSTQFLVQMGSESHAVILRQVAEERDVRWQYLIDLDVGMHRTGIDPAHAFELHAKVSDWPEFEFAGLHGYDGHIHHPDAKDRERETQKSMAILSDVYDTFVENGVSIPRIITSGSISFRYDLKILVDRLGSDTLVQVSPGNWVYWDTGYDKIIPGEFEIAAVVLAQVIEVKQGNRITLNLGHKRYGVDRGPVEVFSPPGLKFLMYKEEHTVLEFGKDMIFQTGDYVLIMPNHACSTVNVYEHFTVIGKDGKIEISESPVDGRNR